MKSVKFLSSFKKIRSHVSRFFASFYSFKSTQRSINHRIVDLLEKHHDVILNLNGLLEGHKQSINFLYERNEFLSKRLRFLQNVMIVISSILVGVIFYLFSIFNRG